MAIQTYHVNGTATIFVGPMGALGSLTALGIAEENGIGITTTHYDMPIYDDDSGPSVPAELQDMGSDAIIKIPLVFYDRDVLEIIKGKRKVGGAPGRSPSRGKLLLGNNLGFRLVIVSPIEAFPYRFFFCTLRGPQDTNKGTIRSTENLTVYALENELPNLGPGKFLFDNVAA